MTIFEAQWILIADDFRGRSAADIRQALDVAKANDWVGVTRHMELDAELWLDAYAKMAGEIYDALRG